MKACLELNAALHGWNCFKCGQLYDAFWRPIPNEKAWEPPKMYQWMIDKPTFKFCPMCGVKYGTNDENRT